MSLPTQQEIRELLDDTDWGSFSDRLESYHDERHPVGAEVVELDVEVVEAVEAVAVVDVGGMTRVPIDRPIVVGVVSVVVLAPGTAISGPESCCTAATPSTMAATTTTAPVLSARRLRIRRARR